MVLQGIVPDPNRKPKAKPLQVEPGLYYLRLVSVEEAPPTPKSEEYGISWLWKFAVVTPNFEVKTITRDDGTVVPHLLVQFTSDKLGKKPQVARACMFLEGFLGPLEVGATAQELVDEALAVGVANGLLTVDTRKPDFMVVGQMLMVKDQAIRDQVKTLVDAMMPDDLPEGGFPAGTSSSTEVPF